MKSFFVTGTDTGIGKTYFTSALARLMHDSGIDVGVMKPFATGTPQKGGFKSEDVELLVRHSGVSDSESLINPCFFEVPASPYTASKKTGGRVDMDLVLSSFEKLQSCHDVMLVEGIGGILTPILRDYFVADLIRDLNLDALVVTGTRLGTINHTLLTLDACKKYGIRPAGLVINNTAKNGYNVLELEADLVSLSGIDVVCKIPPAGSIEQISQILRQNNLVDVLSRL